MKKFVFTAILMAAVAGLCSCNKETVPNGEAIPETGKVPICFGAVDDGGFEVLPSKVSGSVNTMYFTATSGSAGSSEVSWPTVDPMINKPYSENNFKYSSAYYWGDSALNFYATNWSVTPSVAASGASISFSGLGLSSDDSRDYIAGCLKSVANKTNPVTIKVWHILGYLEGMYFTTASSDATATLKSVTLTPKFTSGKYTFASNAAGTWSGQKTAGPGTNVSLSTKIITFKDGGTSIGNCSYTMIPSSSANLTITVTYTVTRPGYTSSEITKSADVTIPAGTKSMVVGKLTDDATPITFSVLLQLWTDKTLTPEF